MGYDATGILAFGVDLGEEGGAETPWYTEDDEEEDSFDNWISRLADADVRDVWKLIETFEEPADWKKRYVKFEEKQAAWEAAFPGTRAKLDEAHERKKAFEDAMPIEFVLHGGSEPASELIAVKGTVTQNYFGSVKEVVSLDVDPVKLDEARAFCAENGIPFEDPKWLLASWLSY